MHTRVDMLMVHCVHYKTCDVQYDNMRFNVHSPTLTQYKINTVFFYCYDYFFFKLEEYPLYSIIYDYHVAFFEYKVSFE